MTDRGATADDRRREPPARAVDLYLFFALALGITWLLDVPFAQASIRGLPPPGYALALTGLGAFGPTLAALAMGIWRRELRDIFGRWRTNPIWIVAGLLTVPALHMVANLLELAVGGRPASWLYPPLAPERLAAFFVFPVAEEFGWRGYAYPRLARRHGPVIGCLVLGFFWAIWHAGMVFMPGRPPDLLVALMPVELAAGSLIFAWVFEHGRRSMAVAIALHMGAHLDNTNLAPTTEIRLRLLRLAVLVVAALFAARALHRSAAARAGA